LPNTFKIDYRPIVEPFAKAFAQLPNAVILANQFGEIVFLNSAAFTILYSIPSVSAYFKQNKYTDGFNESKNKVQFQHLISDTEFDGLWQVNKKNETEFEWHLSPKNQDNQTIPLNIKIRWLKETALPIAVICVKDATLQLKSQFGKNENETRLERALSGTSDGLWDWDLIKPSLWFSKRFKQLLDYNEAKFDLEFSSFEDNIHPDDLESFKQALDEHLEDHLPFDIEYRLKTAKRQWRWFRARGQAIWDINDNPILMSGSIMDISLQKAAYLQIEKYTQSLEQLHHITTVTNLDFDEKIEFLLDLGTRVFDLDCGLISRINELDYTIAYSVGAEAPRPNTVLNFNDTYCQTTVELNCPTGYHQASKSELEKHPCYRHLKIEAYIGTPIFVNHTLLGTLCFTSNQPKQDPFVKTDYSLVQLFAEWIGNELASAETKMLLKESNALQKAILNSAPIAIIYTSTAGTITSFNRGAESLLQYSPIDIEHKFTPLLFHLESELHQKMSFRCDQAFSCLDYLEQLIAMPNGESEWTFVKKSGAEFPAQISITAVYDNLNSQTGYLILASDMSERKRTEKLLIEAKNQAEQNDRMKSEFINMMSHELRTPLTVILGYLPILQNKDFPISPEEIYSIADEMQSSGDHLLQLINDLLDLSKIEAGKLALKKERLSLKPILAEAIETFRNKADSKGLKLICHCPNLTIYADKFRINQILFNLIGNSIKFTENGFIKVSAALLEPTDTTSHENPIEISVEDSGIGIQAKDINFIFERFKQSGQINRNSLAGTGLGLAITKQLVQLHKGQIDVASKLGKGTCFKFTLPSAENQKP
jgi:PAS domain S-box-containing protein